MGDLNYHHLQCFWAVAREGGLRPAGRRLYLTPQTLSGQIRLLERALGERLFERSGRRLALTEVGRLAFRYAEEIFALGGELRDALAGRPTGRPLRVVVGVADSLSKLVVRRLLEPVLRLPEPVHLLCTEGRTDRLLAALALHEVDAVLSDAPVPPAAAIRAFSHPLGESGVTFMAAPRVATRLRTGYPLSLEGAPMLLPTEGTTLRRALDQWLAERGLRPRIVAEFDDTALLKAFGQLGHGLFPVHGVVEAEVRRQFGAVRVGRVDGVRERFYVLSAERRLRNPAVVALREAALGHAGR